MKKSILTGFILAILIANSHALTIARKTLVCTNPPPVWETALSFGVTLTSGNNDSTLLNTGFKTHRNNPTNEWLISLDGSYGENESVKSSEMLHGVTQYNHLFDPRTYAYGRADGLHDAMANVAYRATISPGAGYYFIKTKETTFAGEAGPGAIFQKLDGSTEYYAVPRIAERFERKIDGHAHVWENMEFLPQLDETKNFLVNAEIGIETPITKTISLRTVVDDNFANVPAPGYQGNDVKLLSGLVYKF